MSVIWQKVWHDVWNNKNRTLLAVLSIAAGLFAVGAIFGMVDQLLSGMDQAHEEVAPSHVNIILRNFITQDVIDDLKTIPGIVDIDPLNQIAIRYRIQPKDDWQLGMLVMRPDFDSQIYDIQVLKDGDWPEEDKIGVERLSSQYFDVPVGNSVTFQIDGEEKTFTVGSLVRHPFVQPPLFGGQAHFFLNGTQLEDFGIPSGYFGQLLVRVEPYSREFSQNITGEIRSRLADQGYGVVVSLYQDPDLHWGRMFVEGITLIMRLMAVVSLILSVVLVMNTMTALITQQTDQIGVIKAIGGQRQTIMRIYLASVTIYGLLALLPALPLSALFAFYMSQWFLNLFNVDYLTFQVSQRAVLLTLLSGLLAPIFAAFWPVLKGASITVRQAISSYGLGGDFGSGRFDRAVEHFGARYLPAVYSAALGNMFRRKARLVLSLFVLTTAGVMFIIVMTLIQSINYTLDNEMARQRYDIRLGFTENQPISTVLDTVAAVDGVQSAEMWYSRNATILREGERLKDSAGLGAQLIGIPADTDMYLPIITSGRWIQPGDERAVVISAETAQLNQIAVGDTITLDLGELGNETWEVIGEYRVIYGSGFQVEPIYAPLNAVAQVTGQIDEGTQVVVNGNIVNLEQETALSNRLKSALEDAGFKLDFYTTASRLDARSYADNQFNSIISMLLSLAMLVAMVGGIGLMGSLAISVVERTREIGVLRSIGARSPAIMSLFVAEGILQGLLSFIISIPIAFILAQPLARQLGRTMLEIDLDFSFSYSAVGIWLAVIFIISILASVLPARSATRISVRESLSYA
jgi:putative ABC transport system permease protein